MNAENVFHYHEYVERDEGADVMWSERLSLEW